MNILWLLVFVFASTSGDRSPKVYRVNLDLPPEKRWNHVVVDFKDQIPALTKEIQQYFMYPFGGLLCWFCEKIAMNFPEEYMKEMEGISKASGLEYCHVIGLNILYDITNYNRLMDAIHAGAGCTSIVAEDSSGHIVHGRNLDYLMVELLKNITILVDFTRNDKIVYSVSTFAFFTGAITGQRPQAFTLSLNARRSGWYINTLLMQLYTAFRQPVGISLRQTLEDSATYRDALKDLQQIHVMNPCYIILGGTESGEGAIITRDRWGAADVLELDSKRERWFIVQTNHDHWLDDEDNRKTTAEIVLRDIKQTQIDEDSMWSVLITKPVYNRLTLTTTVMSATDPGMFYRSTLVRE